MALKLQLVALGHKFEAALQFHIIREGLEKTEQRGEQITNLQWAGEICNNLPALLCKWKSCSIPSLELLLC